MPRAEPPDLIVWPETAYPYGYIAIDPPSITRRSSGRSARSSAKITVEEWIERKKLIADELHHWTDRANVPMLVGSIFYDHQPGRGREVQLGDPLQPRSLRLIHFYHKMHLVPVRRVRSLHRAAALAVDPDSVSRTEGARVSALAESRSTLPLGKYRLAVTICFEDTVPQVIARFLRRVRARTASPMCSSTCPTTAGSTAPQSSTCTWRSACSGRSNTGCRWLAPSTPGCRRSSMATARSSRPCPRTSRASCR